MVLLFDATREDNRTHIAKHFNTDTDPSSRQLFIQRNRRGAITHRGVGTAGDVECMFVKAHKPLSQMKKKARINYAGTTASVMYPNVSQPSWRSLAQVDAVTKAKIFVDPCPKPFVDSLDPSKWATPAATKKNRIPKTARNCLPMNWWERDVKFFLEIFDNFNLNGIVDLFGSVNMAKACLLSSPPRPYLALLRNDQHVAAFVKGIDDFIMREMGREGPPPSPFFIAEMKDLSKRLFPPLPEVDEADSDDDASDDNDDA